MSKKKKPNKGKATKVEIKDLFPVPKSIRIGYQDYTLLVTPYSFETQGRHGETNRVLSTIHLNELGNDLEMANTLIHEILHAVVHVQGLTIDHDLEETVVNAVANGLTQVMRDNPETVFYILSKMGYE